MTKRDLLVKLIDNSDDLDQEIQVKVIRRGQGGVVDSTIEIPIVHLTVQGDFLCVEDACINWLPTG